MGNVSLIAQIADQTTSQAAGVVAPVVPSGAIMTYAGSAAPTGWLLCDGTAVSRTTFSALFASIGTTFGAGDGSTTFNLPDLRGRFVRYDDNMGNHGIPGVTPAGAAGRDSARTHGSAQNQTTAANGLGGTAAGQTQGTSNISLAAGSVTGTINIAHTHGSSSVTGTTNIAHNHNNTGVSGSVDVGHSHGGSAVSGNTGDDVHQYGHPAVGDGGGANTAIPDYLASAGERDRFSNRQHSHTVSLTAVGQTLATTFRSLTSGLASPTLASSDISLASGSAAGQLQGATATALDSGAIGASTTNIAHTHGASTLAVTGDSETRPINIALNAIIKV